MKDRKISRNLQKNLLIKEVFNSSTTIGYQVHYSKHTSQWETSGRQLQLMCGIFRPRILS